MDENSDIQIHQNYMYTMTYLLLHINHGINNFKKLFPRKGTLHG